MLWRPASNGVGVGHPSPDREHELGGLQVAAGLDGARAFRARAGLAADLGVAGEYLEPQEIASRWPNLCRLSISAKP